MNWFSLISSVNCNVNDRVLIHITQTQTTAHDELFRLETYQTLRSRVAKNNSIKSGRTSRYKYAILVYCFALCDNTLDDIRDSGT